MSYSVLRVDDDKSFLRAAAKSLSDKGHEVFTAESGQAAYRLLESRAQQFGGTPNVNAIVSDWQMPDGNGLELLSQLRKGPHHAIAFVLMSGAVSREELQDALRLGPDAVILKPFNVDALCRKLEQAIQKREEAELSKLLKDIKN